ncbi:c-type cytochrome [Nitrosophilus alvini]|uniref:c-type cytochrome n=1 Tax=Nitrosophilus alvini TaxID=2714855 RepID=UPI00190E128D|nr:c-type cytochrome [Nitrosophilus alvini]
MIKHIIAGVAGLLSIAAIAYMAYLDIECRKFEHIKEIIEKSKMEVPVSKQHVQPVAKEPVAQVEEKQEDETQKQLKALKEKAGNIAVIKVSPLYKKKCASCHGVTGEGIIGPKLLGKSKEELYSALIDFKSGKRKNYVMYGLLSQLDEEQLEQLAEEISSFEEKLRNR